MVTIKEVAEKAHVSPGTVSKVLKGYSNISQDTRDRVKAVIKELGYVPNSIASALSSKRGKRIAVYSYTNDKSQHIDEIDMSYLLGAFMAAEECDCRLVTLFYETMKSFSIDEAMAYLNSFSFQAIIIFGHNNEDLLMKEVLASGRYKCVVIDQDMVSDEVSSVTIDHLQAQKEVALKVLKENDHILYLAGRKGENVAELRLKGIEEALKEVNGTMDLRYGDFLEENAYEIAKREVGEYNAIICASDLMALGARNAYPYLPVTGFDGISLLGYVAPNMWTCKQDFKEIGSIAVKEATRLLEGNLGRKILVPYTITQIHKSFPISN